MKAAFNLPPTKFRPETAPATPYLKARQEWDTRIGQTVVQARNWRLAFFSLCGISVVISGALAYQLSQHSVIPFVITVNAETGEPRVLGKVGQANFQPQTQEIKYFLGGFVQRVRSISSDPVVIKRNWVEAYAFLRREAALLLNEIANREMDSPLKRIGERTTTVQLLSVNQVEGASSYQVRWRETVYGKNGGLEDDYTMTGIFSIEVETPTAENILMTNPLGLFIKNFQWSRELASGSELKANS